MSVNRFKFVSPGVFLKEIDNSQLPRVPGGVGPVIIGRFEKGPAMKPVKIQSPAELKQVFGDPIPGGSGRDAWRAGNGLQATAYAPYAARAYLKAGINSPVTVVRLLGITGDDATGLNTGAAVAGWEAKDAYGIFLGTYAAAQEAGSSLTGSLAAILYTAKDNVGIGVQGIHYTGSETGAATTASATLLFKNSPVDQSQIRITGPDGTVRVYRAQENLLDNQTHTFAHQIDLSGVTYDNQSGVSTTGPAAATRLDFNRNRPEDPHGAAALAAAINDDAGHGLEGDTSELSAVASEIEGTGHWKVVITAVMPNSAAPAIDGNRPILVSTASGGVPAFDRAAVEIPDSFSGGSLATAEVSSTTTAKDAVIKPVRLRESKDLDILISGSNGVSEVPVSFKRTDERFLRKKLNTNPVLTNGAIVRLAAGAAANADKYWLGETFEETYEHIRRNLKTGERIVAWVMKLGTGTADFKSLQHQLSPASTGWLIPQHSGGPADYDLNSSQKLFRFHALQDGEQGNSLYASIEKIKIARDGAADPYGQFDVIIKKVEHGVIKVVETFPGCNLNPNSEKYIANQIGDTYFKWDTVEKRNKMYGNYPTTNDHVRVEMNPDIDLNGPSVDTAVPFGFFGPIAPSDITMSVQAGGVYDPLDPATNWAGQKIELHSAFSDGIRLTWPGHPIVTTGSANPTLTGRPRHFGASMYNKADVRGVDRLGNTTITGEAVDYSQVNQGGIDYSRRFSSFLSSKLLTSQESGIISSDNTEAKYSFVFSMDDIIVTGAQALPRDLSNFDPTSVEWRPGSFSQGLSYTGHIESGAGTQEDPYVYSHFSASSLLSVAHGFTVPFGGGFDGVDITEADPFNNSPRVMSTAPTTRSSYAYASIDRAIELIRDPEAVEMNLAAMPGITVPALTTKLVQTCEARADSLAIIDLPDVYIPPAEKRCTSLNDRIDDSTPESVAKALVKRQINSSYGATYYPWVMISDPENSSKAGIWVPPSVIALGVMAYSEKKENAVWFAPAGFNRGGLTEGNAGYPVMRPTMPLLSSQRDTLYEANINPIASFVSEGLVVFGQKTLQSTQSALDRINVRRLLIFIKREVSRISNNLLFDQNLPATWNRFLGQVVPFLENVKTQLGLSDFKVVLDESTTTPDLIDRNIMYAKIFLKPARAIEFIAVDFVITRTGAGFDD